MKKSAWLIVTILLTLTLILPRPARAFWFIDSSGRLSLDLLRFVLGESDDNSGKKEEDNSGKREEETKTVTVDPATGTITKIETKSSGETETEIKFTTGEKIKTEIRDGRSITKIEREGLEVKLIREGDKFVIKTETDDGSEVELEEENEFRIEERLGKNEIKVATGSGEGNELVFSRNGIGAATNFPLSVDLATNNLIITTPAGTKTVTVLPDQAVQNLLIANVIDRLSGPVVAAALNQGTLTGLEGIVTLGEQNGLPVYEIAGLSDQKLLGFIPVVIATTAQVSAETGEIVATQKSALNTLIDLISF